MKKEKKSKKSNPKATKKCNEADEKNSLEQFRELVDFKASIASTLLMEEILEAMDPKEELARTSKRMRREEIKVKARKLAEVFSDAVVATTVSVMFHTPLHWKKELLKDVFEVSKGK